MGKGLTLLLTLLLASCVAAPAYAQDAREFVPPGARTYAPVLVEEQMVNWPTMPQPWTLGGLVEQESCITLKHSKCWNPRAELKTSREYGFGFGQVTVAYRANGAVRFDKFNELRSQYSSLRDWTWEGRYEPRYQLRAIVLMTLELWRKIPPAYSVEDHLAFTLSSYNGGVAALLQDRRLCSNTPGCDPGRWFGNVERTSLKSKVPQPQYGGKSWFDINRGHVRNVMLVRRAKYKVFWGS
jgi:hypothetical protein